MTEPTVTRAGSSAPEHPAEEGVHPPLPPAQPALSPENAQVIQLTRKDFVSDQEVRWCPGCGDYSILAQTQKQMPDFGVPKENIVFISGIGCSGRLPYYMNTYGFHTIHGRAPTLATGLKAARPELMVWVITGDGDALSIGGNHVLHSMRRNVDITMVMFNNRIYGLTKGQASPTSERGKVTKSTPTGSIESPVDAVSLALGAGATFVARSIDRDKQHLPAMLRAAAAHPGTALVEILQNCPVFNDDAFEHVADKGQAPLHRIALEHGQPVIFGAERERCVARAADGSLVLADVADVAADAIVVHDAHRPDPSLAFALSRLGDIGEGPVPIGIFRSLAEPAWGDGLVAQNRAAHASAGDDELDALLHAGNTWTIA
jgi:2-oxoglutarate ferredoxin oxidoreductase subunit beta